MATHPVPLAARLGHALPYFCVLAVVGALYVSAQGIDTSGTAGGQRIGPDFWPKLVLLLAALLCLLEIGKRLWTPSASATAAGTPPDDAAPAAPPPATARFAGGLALIAGFVALVPLLGFFVATALFLGAFTWVGGYRRPVPVLLVSVLGSLLMVVMFMRIAYVSLPLGAGPMQTLSLSLLHLLGVR